ncbi:ABC transporter permease [Paenibacillus sp. 32O-W]|jgi:putative aldouronate transport system permease protein|uniref:carbohydrate ABC transporter permease n=1 Tax=Paenibacillus sp. 32O-W TaxID=1695218 RepID=UPI00071F4056|nr:carbohydrate ABC transporter permease [Paenibacillus sp. 32O-W]ALS29480.1 ABC transporter permease [Paenibacillus sp. 32O-W]
MKRNASGKIADIAIVAAISIAGVLCLVPMLHIFALSLSSNGPIMAGKVTIFPVDIDLTAYMTVFGNALMLRSLLFTIVLVALFTTISMAMTVMAAYPLTKPKLKGRNLFLVLIVITMFFSGGMIPEYLLVKNLRLLDSIWALILPGMVNAFYLLIAKTFFSSIPVELEESARMDGAGHFRILTSLILPLSLPVLATLSLFYAVGRWNGFMDALLYITNTNLYPLQLRLYEMVINSQVIDMATAEGLNNAAPVPESLKAASIMFATVPILLVYPWLQRYFVSGMMIGAVKG